NKWYSPELSSTPKPCSTNFTSKEPSVTHLTPSIFILKYCPYSLSLFSVSSFLEQEARAVTIKSNPIVFWIIFIASVFNWLFCNCIPLFRPVLPLHGHTRLLLRGNRHRCRCIYRYGLKLPYLLLLF